MPAPVLLAAILGICGLIVRAQGTFTNGLVTHYPLNGNANDESGKGNHGSIHGAVSAPDRFGLANGCYRFDGIAAYIKAAADRLPTGVRTVSLWFNADTVETQPVLLGYGGISCGESFFMGLNNLRQSAYCVNSHCSPFQWFERYSRPPVNAWHHWAVVLDANQARMFLDGRPLATNNGPFPATFVTGRDLCLGSMSALRVTAPMWMKTAGT